MSTQLFEYLRSRHAEQIELLRWLVEMESPSDSKPLVDRLADELANRYNDLDVPARVILQENAGNLCFAEIKGDGQPILLLGHIDTVYPQGTLVQQPFVVRDGRAYGPGIFDMKSGIAATLELCRARRESLWRPQRTIRMLWTSDEEVGSAVGRPHLEQLAQDAEAVLVLEPPLPGGRAKTGRKGVGQFVVRALGRSAHAGIAPETGVNAIEELAHHILRLHQLNDAAAGVSVTVGIVHGGTRANVVPAEAEAVVDFRFTTAQAGRELEAAICGLVPVLSDARLEISGGINRPPLERTPGVVALLQRARSASSPFGFELGEGSTGGGSDGSFTAALGVPTLDGLGIDGNGAHSTDEYILLKDFPRKTAILGKLIESF